jgi:hypothetical protein
MVLKVSLVAVTGDPTGDDTETRQAEEEGGSVGCDPCKLVRGLVFLLQVEC